MTSQDQLNAAWSYEELFVESLFGAWAPLVLDEANIEAGDRVLDVGCGTGILAREAIKRTTSSGEVVGIDPAPGMIAVAREIEGKVDWREGVAESLPFPNGSFDTVVSQFGLMFFRDQRLSIAEMLRVLAPSGRLAILVWDSLDNNPAYASEVAMLEEIVGSDAANALRAPFVLGDKENLAEIFVGSGVTSPEISTHEGYANFPSIRTMVEADLRGWLPAVGVVLTEDQVDRVLREAEHVLAPYSVEDGRAQFLVSAHLVTARKGQ